MKRTIYGEKRSDKFLVVSYFQDVCNQDKVLAVFGSEEEEIAMAFADLQERKYGKSVCLAWWDRETLRRSLFPTSEEIEEINDEYSVWCN